MYHLIQNPHYGDRHRADQQAALDHAYAVTPGLTPASVLRALRRAVARLAGWLAHRPVPGRGAAQGTPSGQSATFSGMRGGTERRRTAKAVPPVSKASMARSNRRHQR